MWKYLAHISLVAAVGAFLLSSVTTSSKGMEFSLSAGRINATGEIKDGDGLKLTAAIRNAPRDEMDVPDVIVSFDSPGGSLFEGIRIGEAIRAAGVPTIVEEGHVCASACAIAFLGGKISGVSSDAVGRWLEIGASLGFHGFRLSDDHIEVANETLNSARIVDAFILEYALKMGDIDLGAISQLLNTPLPKSR
ncbi:hypothetical protein [Mesorhizobium huakuii]|uniref:Uncharacterized protein n=1 Tax=Mesorhizobium huakuii TaxID=28104 RepID=A0A7G6SZA6_9HYPH|nr:hypothetical protein [Mesorhizobium huakuii]QND59838.1 hypothetical protein HB778_27240 [Mesorhizobium huakuii]